MIRKNLPVIWPVIRWMRNQQCAHLLDIHLPVIFSLMIVHVSKCILVLLLPFFGHQPRSSHSFFLLFDHFTTPWILHFSRIDFLVSMSLKITPVITQRILISVPFIFFVYPSYVFSKSKLFYFPTTLKFFLKFSTRFAALKIISWQENSFFDIFKVSSRNFLAFQIVFW